MKVDQRTFGWYDTFLASLWAVTVVCFLLDEISVRHSRLDDPQGLARSPGFAPLFGLACLLACTRGLWAIGSSRIDGIRLAALRAAESEGGFLEPVGRMINRQFGIRAMALVGLSTGLAAVYILCGADPQPLPPVPWVLIGELYFLVLGLLALFAVMMRWRELTLRAIGLVLGLQSLLTVVYFTGFAGLASISASVSDVRGPQSFLEFESELRSGTWPPESLRSRADPVVLDRLRRTVTLRHAMLRSTARTMLAGPIFTTGIR